MCTSNMDNREPVESTALPVWELRGALSAAWDAHNRVVLVAPTGSGKTTQVCQMILQDGRNRDKQIVVLQPRRVAARTVARRVAQEMGVELGSMVGYQVRFEDVIAPETRIAFVTEGILLRWMQDDPTLSKIGAILFDEFHERNLLSDIGLALVKSLQQHSRPDLLVMVMSATLDAAPLTEYLGECAVLESQGRAYPVEMHYSEWDDDLPVWEQAAQKAAELLRETDTGDILIFMPGAYEIQSTIEELRHSKIKTDIAIIPLHGELSPQDQDRAFATASCRRIIVSTNVAETSVTLPGIRFVIDSGQARIARFDTEHGISTLHIEPISRASAEQRAGRAGRLGPGDCYRLWTLDNHAKRPERNTPEIQRMELAEVVLLLHSFGVTDAEHFDFLDKPDVERVHRAEELLVALGAITAEPHCITDTGREMLRLPMHPRYARMVIEAKKFGCMREIALFVSLVSGRDLLTRLNREDKSARRNRDGLTRLDQSDYYLLAASFAHALQNHLDYKTCYSYGVNPHVAREVAMTYRQILDILNLKEDDTGAIPLAPNEAIQHCHLVGFIDQLAVRQGGSEEFELVNGRHGTLMQESVARRSPLIVVSEIREITTRQGDKLTLIGIASAVDAKWLRELNPPQLHEMTEHVYNRLNKRVVAARVLRYNNLVIAGEALQKLDPVATGQVLANEFVYNPHPMSVPRWEREVKPWLRMVARKRTQEPELDLPEFTDEKIVQVLALAWEGGASFKEVADRPLLPAFRAQLTDAQLQALSH